ncbi:Predicted arabinose efflux permease, MFS family [Lentzea xinjiangensis]|uniref:Predicted arabinose efflux permease, MFS family n=1 Tax=Lentzea xinjiangensis TaxID=402600 RepID=A0A1H9VN18_9PSEU|nr:MFS transporter [Lentzea xinjiangensis]SES22593.1 Predicted arabinose efflux permease, MFS family [Lentzea xinjiangensis]
MTASAWAPLRRGAFRALWLAQFASNIGTWAQTVGAQWLMGDLGGSALQVALVQTATTLPVFLLVVPSGALGDILDRRRVLMSGQALMLAGAGGLVLLAGAERATPASLLGLIALMAIGQALSMPSFQAIQPELVPREEIPQAALLNGVNMNVGRAIGPALGGLLIALAGPEATFALNTVSFIGVLIVLARWRRPSDHRPLGAEHITTAMRTGARYVGSSPLFRRVLARLLLFIVFGSGLWALLPAIARGPLQLDASGYGVLLGSVGAGAIGGAFMVPKLLQRMSKNRMVLLATFVYAAATSTAVLVGSIAVVIVAMLLTGACWIATLSTFNATAQVLLPAWTRARALAYYQLILMGGQALGAVVWGAIADVHGLQAAMIVPAVAMAAGALAASRWLPLLDRPLDVSPATYWEEPPEVDETDAGPVLVTVEWPVAEENEDDFIDAMQRVGRARRRTGATMWGLFRDTGKPETFLETFTVATWQEHLRQHLERGTVVDQQNQEAARALAKEAPQVRHLLFAEPGKPEEGSHSGRL